MAYLGRGLDKISNIEVLDNITFDGSSSYSITKGSVAFTPNSAQSCLISIDGVVQATNFSVNSSTIDFGVAIPSTSTCNFFLHYGTGVMTDGSVTTAKLGDNSVTTAKINNGAITSAKLGTNVGGKVLQVVSTTKTDVFVTTSTSFTDVTGLSVSITPSSTSNKILVLSSIVWGHDAVNSGGHLQLNRGSSALSTYNLNFSGSYTGNRSMASFNYLDSPNSTSAQTYKIQVKADSGNLGVNRSNTSTNDMGDSTITVMEIAG